MTLRSVGPQEGRSTSEPIPRLLPPSEEVFRREYLARDRPVVLPGLAAGWPACERWDMDHLRASFPGRVTRVHGWPRGASISDPAHAFSIQHAWMSMDTFVQHALDGPEHYVADWNLLTDIPELERDLRPLTSYMRGPAPRSSLVREMPVRFFLGGAGSGTPLHYDAMPNLLVQIFGRRQVLLFSPDDSRYLQYPSDDTKYLNFSPVDILAPDLRRFPGVDRAVRFEADLEPGDVLYIPPRWWHFLRSVEPACAVSYQWLSGLALSGAREYVSEGLRRMGRSLTLTLAEGVSRPRVETRGSSVRFHVRYENDVADVWRALTDARAISFWMLPTDFRPEAGATFEFRETPRRPVRSRVLRVDPERELAYTFGDSLALRWTLEPDGTGTNVFLSYHGLKGAQKLALGLLWYRILAFRLPAAIGTIGNGQLGEP